MQKFKVTLEALMEVKNEDEALEVFQTLCIVVKNPEMNGKALEIKSITAIEEGGKNG